MKNLSLFQAVLLIVFGGGALVGVLIFAGIIPGFKSTSVGVGQTVTMWGTIPADRISRYIQDLNKAGEGQFRVDYIAKNKNELGDEFLEALADNKSPDIVLAPQDVILRHRDKIQALPFTSFNKRRYEETFVSGTNIFETREAYLALPVAVDPLVLYYNEDIYTASKIATPPNNWEEFVLNQPTLTKTDNLNRLTQSAFALGTSNNIFNAKAIYSLLALQAGAKPLSFDGVSIYASLARAKSGDLNPAIMALDFYNQFSDPTRTVYTWNRSLPLDRDHFLAGNLANYFGYASERNYLLEKNPHLNFNVAPVPRLNAQSNITLGNFYGLFVPKRSAKANAAFNAIFAMALTEKSGELANFLGAYSVKRADIKPVADDPVKQVFLGESLASQTWADFSPIETDNIIKKMIDNSSSGRFSAQDSIRKADDELTILTK